MRNDQVLVLLKKIRSWVEDRSLLEWPTGLSYDFSSRDILTRVELITTKCKIIISLDWNWKKLNIDFKVGGNHITGSSELPTFMLRSFSPVWREWRRTSKAVLNKHTKLHKMKHDQEMEKQSEIFNNLFYTSFPEEIDDIFFNSDNDD